MITMLKINDFRQFKDVDIELGKMLTVFGGRNSTGKSTLLGLLANSCELKKSDGTTLTGKQFRAEFSEIIKASKDHDTTGSKKYRVVTDGDNKDENYRDFRAAWHKDTNRDRYHLVPTGKIDGEKTETKFKFPVIYLGLSRLFPVGESSDDPIQKTLNLEQDEIKWFFEQYKSILCVHDSLLDIVNFPINYVSKVGVGVNTEKYDYLTNSAGQDNVGQILLALLSFERLSVSLDKEWHGGMLLIDELDASLHPYAQVKLLELLLKQGRKYKIQVVFTTHSETLLREVCKKVSFNSDKLSDVELYYFTAANFNFKVLKNPSFDEVESDLNVRVSNGLVKVYTEDAEARWLLERILPLEVRERLEFLDVKIGCMELIGLYNADIAYFKNVIVVLDGDVSSSQFSQINKENLKRFLNVLKLPGQEKKMSPEILIEDFINKLPEDHEFWNRAYDINDFTKDIFEAHSAKSDDYKNKTKRERYKDWFNDNKRLFEDAGLMEYWKKENESIVENFIGRVKMAYNIIAARQMIKKLKE